MSTAAPVNPAKLMTAEDLLALGPDFHGELVRGKLIEMAPAGWIHGVVAMNVARIVGNFVYSNRLGLSFAAETGFTIERGPDTVRAPDYAFVKAQRLPNDRTTQAFFEGVPDLAVEVLSPSNTVREIADKVRDYLANGCGLVWVFNPIRRTVTVHEPGKSDLDVLGTSDTLSGADVLPGFTSPVADFFE